MIITINRVSGGALFFSGEFGGLVGLVGERDVFFAASLGLRCMSGEERRRRER